MAPDELSTCSRAGCDRRPKACLRKRALSCHLWVMVLLLSAIILHVFTGRLQNLSLQRTFHEQEMPG